MDTILARPPAYENKKNARRMFEEVWDNGQLAVANQLVAPSHALHAPQSLPNAPRGPEGMKYMVSLYRRAFPDMQHTIEDQMVEGDKVVTRWTIHGTHKGELFGMAATGRRVVITGITIDRMSGGKIAETWTDMDLMGLMQQIGAIPLLHLRT